MRRLIALLLMALLGPAALATLLAKSANVWWVAELAVHFKLQYLVIGLLCVAPAIWLRRWVSVALAALCIVVNAHPAAQYFRANDLPGDPLAVTTQTHAKVRIASLNVWYGNTDYESVASWIESTDPDVVVLVEASAKWQKVLATKLPEWPHQHLELVAGKSGKMILSKQAPTSIQSFGEGATRAPLPVATIEIDGVPIRVAAVHTDWPIGEANAASRNRSFDAVVQVATAEGPALITAGDFNSSPFSPHFESMLRDGQLMRSSAARGWLPTWPHFLPFAGIQIDHILVPGEVTVAGFSVYEGLGSDHHGIIADLRVPRP